VENGPDAGSRRAHHTTALGLKAAESTRLEGKVACG